MRAPTNYYSQIVANEQQIPKLFNSILIELDVNAVLPTDWMRPICSCPKLSYGKHFHYGAS